MNRFLLLPVCILITILQCRSPDKGFHNAVCDAAKRGEPEQLIVLLDQNADSAAVDDAGTPALVWATIYDRRDAVKLLLERKARVNAVDGRDRSALIWAGILGRKEIAAMLLSHGADPALRDKQNKDYADWAHERERDFGGLIPDR